MGNNDREIIKEYQRLNGIVTEIDVRLDNLKKTDGQISKERYSSQEKEYKDILDNICPKLSDLEKTIKSKLDEYVKELEDIQEKLNPVSYEIQQEKKLLKIGAISKQNYKITVKPLEENLKNLKSQFDSIRDQANELKKVLEKKPSSWKPNFSGLVEKTHVIGKGDFKKDIWTGTIIILIIASILIIGVPLLTVVYGTGELLLKPFVAIFVAIGVIIILIAVFGRFINFVRERW
jgi:hypothetical protein